MAPVPPSAVIISWLPFVVAVTGHRDLVDAELPTIRERIQAFLSELLSEYPDRGVTVMSPLADGADQLVAEEALRLDIPLIVAMPMARSLYIDDFSATKSRERFDYLCSRAVECHELPLTPENILANISEEGEHRSRQYAQLGVFLCAHCQSCWRCGTARKPKNLVVQDRWFAFTKMMSCPATHRSLPD